MAAEVLIGVMIIGVGLYIFNMFAAYSHERYERIEAVQIAEFNEQFLKFYGSEIDEKTKKEIPIECTIHDIVSLANLAQKHNFEYDLIEEVKTGNKVSFAKKNNISINNSLYVQIDLGNKKNIELESNDYFIKLMKENDLKPSSTEEMVEQKFYQCIICESRNDSKRINYVKFVEIK